MKSLSISFCVIFSTYNFVSCADYEYTNSTFIEFEGRESRSPADIENSQEFQDSAIFNTYFSSCASSCSENDTECLGRCSNQNHGDGIFLGRGSKLPSDNRSRIVGGVKVNRSEMPSVVSLMVNGGHECGASIINKRYVLTAAHCLEEFGTAASHYKILVGTLNINVDQSVNPYSTVYKISRVVIHENYKSFIYGYDIAVLRTSTPITYIPGYVEPAKVAKPGQDNCGHATAWGWGRLYHDGPISEDLLKVRLPLVPHKRCSKNYGKLGLNVYNDLQVCYGFENGGKDSCSGDSGGPLTCTHMPHYQIGIVSFGEKCAEANYPGVYTRVSKFRDWIAGKVKH